jgi:phage/plasmid-associated DNA primase
MPAYNLGTQQQLLKRWFDETGNIDFPLVSTEMYNRQYVGFYNGYLNINAMQFYSHARDINIGNELYIRRYWDQQYDPGYSDTPYWDSILSHQFESDVKFALEALIGRLIFRVGEMDYWEFIPYLYGRAGTGKSTIIKTLVDIFGAENTAVISATSCKTFGLQGVNTKSLLVITDMSENVSRVLDQTTIQSMVNINVKHRGSACEKWCVPTIIAGNHNMFDIYSNDQGQLSRRFVTFKFDTPVQNVNTELNVIYEVNTLLYGIAGL